MAPPHLVEIEGRLWVVNEPTGFPVYDFNFEDHFSCRHPWRLDSVVTAVARMGAAVDYDARYRELLEWKVRLVHTPEQYNRTSNLPEWYPLLRDLTPKSVWFEEMPRAADVEADFDWPIFVKGERQTNRHGRDHSIIENPEHFERVMQEWRQVPLLAWQRVVCRQFIPLRPVSEAASEAFPKSFEFRTFWWHNTCVGIGNYWTSEVYNLRPADREQVLALGREVANRMQVTFLVVDIAQARDGKWIVIECNDGQDSGYAGVNPHFLWQNVVDAIGGEKP
jgi:hypothetical protein